MSRIRAAAFQQGDLERTLNSLAAKIAGISEELKRLCAALEHPEEEKLFGLPLPQRASVEEMRQKQQEFDAAAIRLSDKEKNLKTDIASRKSEIGLLEAAGTVVTGDSLKNVRQQRDRIWGGIRRAYVERSATAEDVHRELELQRDIPEEYERQVKAADDQADLLRADTKRATQYAEIERRIRDMTG